MKIENDHTRTDLFKRLRRIEGQMRGVQTMIMEERDCHEILQQLNAIQSAMRGASLQLVETSAAACFENLASADDFREREYLLDDLLTLVKKAS
jgi:CsoR family transcriptional regulator, copper-sensing transcriptional repressor